MAITQVSSESFLRPPLVLTPRYPRLRYMGSKYKVIPYLADVLRRFPFDTALDAFSGSGVVAYALKEMGKQVTANDFLHWPATVARALIENPGVTLTPADLQLLLSPSADGRDFILSTFRGLYFPDGDHAFLDAAWSHIDQLPPYKKELAIAALCLAAAWKQPRGVFTVTSFRYDDGRRQLHTPLRHLFVEAVQQYNRAVFANGRRNRAFCQDVLQLEPDGYDLVYFDPPYAPPSDDADYIKRYHFLEGLSVYWRGLRIMKNTMTKKIAKRYTPFAYKTRVREALQQLFARFRASILVLSYSSNSALDESELYQMLASVRSNVEVYAVPHVYTFGTHQAARRTHVREYIFVAR